VTDVDVVHEVRITCKLWTVNAERRGMHWSDRAELVGAVRWAAKIAALEAKVPHLDRVEILAQPLQSKRGPAADTGAYASPVKAAIDGLRDARVLDDDTYRFVSSIEHLPSIRVEAREVGLILYLTPVAPLP
jgi:hypothetical protein